MQIITLYNYLLFPLYLVIFFLIVRRKAKKYKGTPLKKFFLMAFWLHMFGAIFFAMLMQYYYGYADSFGYYIGGDIIRDMISKDISAVKYLFYSGQDIVSAAEALNYGDKIPITMPNAANAFVMKVSAIFSFFSFGQYLVISLFFGFISFIGTWKLFYVMQKINKGRHIQLLGYATIATPSLWLWGSGLLKEPLCIGPLGLGIFLIYQIFIEKQFSFKKLLFLFFLFYVISVIKSYITAIFIASVLIVLVTRLFFTIKNIVFRLIAVFLFMTTSVLFLISINTDKYINEIIVSSYSQIESFQNNYEVVQEMDEGSKAGFSIGDVQPSLSSMLSLIHI